MHKINKLIVIDDVIVIAKYYHFINEFIMIKRSTASNIKINETKFISLRSCMSMHEIKTIELKYRSKITIEFQ